MTLDDQARYFELFYSGAMGAITQRAKDYAPAGVPLLDLMDTCVEKNSDVPGELWSLFKKQYTAIRRFVAEHQVDSDPITSRIQDACNYLAFIHFYLDKEYELFRAWNTYWSTERVCTCEPDDLELCRKCRTLQWLARHWPPSPSLSSRSILKARG